MNELKVNRLVSLTDCAILTHDFFDAVPDKD